MYRYINENAILICGDTELPRAVTLYKTLMTRVGLVDVTIDAEFRRACENFWRITAARVGPGWRHNYFRVLEAQKKTRTLDVAEITRALAVTPRNKTGTKALDFSFASKLLHMVDPNAPIYDDLIAGFYFFNTPTGPRVNARLTRLCDFYEFLRHEYRRVELQGLLDVAVRQFRETHAVASGFTYVKLIDFLLWTYVRLLRGGSQREGELLF